MSKYDPASVPNAFHKGDRVRYSAAGRAAARRRPRGGQVGIVAAEPQQRRIEQHTIAVRWAGSRTTTPRYYAARFLEKVPDGDD